MILTDLHVLPLQLYVKITSFWSGCTCFIPIWRKNHGKSHHPHKKGALALLIPTSDTLEIETAPRCDQGLKHIWNKKITASSTQKGCFGIVYPNFRYIWNLDSSKVWSRTKAHLKKKHDQYDKYHYSLNQIDIKKKSVSSSLSSWSSQWSSHIWFSSKVQSR